MWMIFHGCRLFFPVVHPVKLGFVEFFFSPFFFQLSIWWFRSVEEYLVLENPFLKISFLRISPTTGFPQWEYVKNIYSKYNVYILRTKTFS